MSLPGFFFAESQSNKVVVYSLGHQRGDPCDHSSIEHGEVNVIRQIECIMYLASCCTGSCLVRQSSIECLVLSSRTTDDRTDIEPDARFERLFVALNSIQRSKVDIPCS